MMKSGQTNKLWVTLEDFATRRSRNKSKTMDTQSRLITTVNAGFWNAVENLKATTVEQRRLARSGAKKFGG
jgi:hypothetical protein